MECIKPPTHNHLTGYQRDHCKCEKCAEAGRTYSREWHRKNRTKEQAAQYRKARRDKVLAIVNKIKMDKGCVVCGYKAHPAALDFHHIGDDKEFHVSQSYNSYSIDRIMKEIDKCAVLCANCHRIQFSNTRYEE